MCPFVLDRRLPGRRVWRHVSKNHREQTLFVQDRADRLTLSGHEQFDTGASIQVDAQVFVAVTPEWYA
jgi:hypothetical protein